MESAKAEERLLNMDFVKAKAKQLGNRSEKAEVRCTTTTTTSTTTFCCVAV